ncbi:MAG: hypothetical protein LBP26_04690 [Clostridiales bacterium]|nr:hypothetical protein [Clostridiales bacterium]
MRYKETDTHYLSEAFTVGVVEISNYYSGTGTESNPYIIKTYEHLTAINGETGQYFRLDNDISFAEKPALTAPINLNVANFDGNGKTISNVELNILYNRTDNVSLGFFNYGYIEHLTVLNLGFTVTLGDELINNQRVNSGLIAGMGSIQDCFASGSLTVSKDEEAGKILLYVGGIVGYTYSGTEITDCGSEVDIIVETADATSGDAISVGGVVGRVEDAPLIARSYYSGDISVTGGRGQIGGIFGYYIYYEQDGATIRDCYSVGTIEADLHETTTPTYIGGIGGQTRIKMANCYSDMDIDVNSGSAVCVGGLYGYGNATSSTDTIIQKSFYSGVITVTPSGTMNVFVGCILPPKLSATQNNLFELTDCYFNSDASYQENGIYESIVIDTTQATGADYTSLISETWQRANLGWSEDIWFFEDGSYPTFRRSA